MKQSVVLALLLGFLVSIATLPGCDSAPSKSRPSETFAYVVSGVMVKEMNTDTASIAVDLLRNGSEHTLAEIVFDEDTLAYNDPAFVIDSVYSFTASPAETYGTGSVPVTVNDSTVFSDTIVAAIPDTLSITEFSPANHLIPGNGSVTLVFSAAAGVEGYVVAAVLSDSAYVGKGWSAYTESLSSSGTITPDAFLGADGQTPVPGLYNVYVYGFTGAPDSAASSLLLPVPLPDQLADNIDRTDLTGHFGVVVVALMDTVRVAQL